MDGRHLVKGTTTQKRNQFLPTFFLTSIKGEEKKAYDEFLFHQTGFRDFPEAEKNWMKSVESVVFSLFFMKHGALLWVPEPLSGQQAAILQRFAQAFEQAYTRFLDLQKAEAQAREAQIEAALERVRARAMAMQNTGELAELIDTLQKELAKLNFTVNNCIFWIIDEEPLIVTWWVAPINNTSLPESYRMQFSNLPYLNSVLNAWKDRIPKWVYKLEGQDKKDMDAYLFTETDLLRFPEEVKRSFKLPDKVYISFSFYNYGGLHISTFAVRHKGIDSSATLS